MFTDNKLSGSGEPQDLLEHLVTGFETSGQKVTDNNLQSFLAFSKQYLTDNRPSEVFSVDNNYGVLLTNGQRIKLCPDTGVQADLKPGDMANPDNSISLTRPR